jgi:bifunctional NMN adenylyltransferase/nudix hydrolase
MVVEDLPQMSKPSVGVIVGRFQVNDLHEGHKALLDAVFLRHKKVVVFLGVSPTGTTKRHPLDFAAREQMIRAAYPNTDGRTLLVLPLKDVMTDEMWSKNLDEKIREVVSYGDVTLYGGRDSFVPHYHGAYDPVELALPPVKTSGEEVRQRFTNEQIASPDFRAGMIHAAMNQYNRVITCVDIIIWHKDEKNKVELLLGKKAGEPGWRFIGGHAEPKTASFEEDARKEVMEETGLELGNLRYVGSCVVPDWRWEKEESKIKSLVFTGEALTLGARASDDIDEVRWFDFEDMAPGLLVPTHRPMYATLIKNAVAQWEEYAAKV